MRSANKWGVVVALALGSSACFYGPDWPPSIERGTNISAGGVSGTSITDAGEDTGTDTGAVSDAGLFDFACIPNAPSTNCIYYKGVNSNQQEQIVTSTCSNTTDVCPSMSAGCCVSTASGYTIETCQYNTTASVVMTACASMGQTYQAAP